jgi:hypothetical protein
MVSSVPPGGGGSHKPEESSGYQIPKAALESIKVKPGDEKLLDTPWGKWMERMPGAPADKEEMIKLIKASIQQYCNMVRTQIEHDQKRSKKAADMLKRVARGQDPNG